MSRLAWTSPPGGKRYTAREGGRVFEVVRQNTAAGALPWKATVTLPSGVTYLVARTHRIGPAKAAAAAWVRP